MWNCKGPRLTTKMLRRKNRVGRRSCQKPKVTKWGRDSFYSNWISMCKNEKNIKIKSRRNIRNLYNLN